jgi:integrase
MHSFSGVWPSFSCSSHSHLYSHLVASITKREKSKYWTACFTDKDGRQLKRSTKTIDRTAALQIALELERVEKQARNGSVTTAQLQRILSDVSEKITGSGINIPSTEEYLNGWLQGIALRIAGPTKLRYENTVKIFLSGLGPKAQQSVTTITPQDIENFLNARLSSRMAPKTVIVDLKTLGTAFRRAEAYNIIVKNPVAAVRLPKDESSERELFSQEEVQKLLNAAPSLEWQTLILFGYFLGARLGDCVHIQWENIRPEQGVIIYTQRKTGKRVVVPMHFNLIQHIEYRASFGTTGFLCPTLVKRVTGGRNGLSGAFTRIIAKAGLDPGKVAGKGVRDFSKRSFHSLRHSFNSALANAGVTEEIRMKLTGHSSKAVHARYTHMEMQTLKNAVTSLPLFEQQAL